MYLLNTRAQIGLIIQIECVMCDPVVVRIWNQTNGEKACRGEGGGVKNCYCFIADTEQEHQSLAGHPAFIRFP